MPPFRSDRRIFGFVWQVVSFGRPRRALGGRAAGGADHQRRRQGLVPPGAPSLPSSACRSRAVARAPSSAIGTRTVESGGVMKRAIGMSSKPATAMSSRDPDAALPERASRPIAIASLAAKTAVGRVLPRQQDPRRRPIARFLAEIARDLQSRSAAGMAAAWRRGNRAGALGGVAVAGRPRDVRDAPVSERDQVTDHAATRRRSCRRDRVE